jgi:hypothetical protein
MVTVKPINKIAVHYICTHLREIDKREIYPLFFFDDPEHLTAATMWAIEHGKGRIIWANGLPAALIGVHPEANGPSCWRVFAFGTDNWKSAAYLCMRELRKLAREVIRETGAMRMHCDSIEEHTEAHSWIERMGGEVESVMPHYGKNGETYRRYVWLRDRSAFMSDPNWKEYAACAEAEETKSNHLSHTLAR